MKATGFIELDLSIEKAMRDMTYLEKQHVPFAFTLALTNTAKECADAVRTVTRSTFELHTEFIPRGIRVQSANVQDLRNFGIAESAVYTAPIISGWMPLHEEGGDKVPRKKAIAIPSDSLNKDFNKTSQGKIRAQLLPKALLKGFYNKKTRKGFKKMKTPGQQAFVITSRRSGTQMVVRRRATKSSPLEVLYIFKQKAHIHAEWNFEKTVRTIAHLRFEPNFQKAFTAVSLLSRP